MRIETVVRLFPETNMRPARKDITILALLSAATLALICILYRNIRYERLAAEADPFRLIEPTPEAVLAINQIDALSQFILQREPLRAIFTEHIPHAFLSLIRTDLPLSSALIAYYPRGSILYASMEQRIARRLFKHLDQAFAFPPQEERDGPIHISYYPDTNHRFLGCYYHEGLFVASYNRRLLTQAIERHVSDTASSLPELARITRRDTHVPLRLFLPSDSVHIHVPLEDSTLWHPREPWLALDLFPSEGNLCCLNEQPREAHTDTTLYQAISDTAQAYVRRLFPMLNTTTQISYDETAVYYIICGH